MRIKNSKKNVMYMIIGRLFVSIGIYGIALQVSIKILEFVVNNCITTIK